MRRIGALDPVNIEVIRNAFLAAADDMKAALGRSAYTPTIYEMKDFSVGIFNENADIMGLSPGLPFFLGGLDQSVKVVTAKVAFENLKDGDIFILNDSYLTGSHLNDVDIVAPIIYKSQVVGFAASRAHWEDLGSKDPAFAADSTEIYQEGLRLSPVKIYDGGLPVDDVIDIISRNSRTPRDVIGDMHAQIASCLMGVRRTIEIIERFSLETVRAAMVQVFAASEEVERKIINVIPDGVYEAQGWVDNDFQTGEAFLVKVKVTVKDSDLNIDTTGSSKQRQGNTNCGYPQTVAACRLAYNFLINPTEGVTGGSFRPLKINVEKGSVFDAEEPAACLQYGTHTMLLVDLIIKSLAEAIPNRVAAGLPGDAWNVIIIGNDTHSKEMYVYGEATAGGWGASVYGDGASAVIHSAAGDFCNIPVETLENRYPIKILRYALGRDSEGAGRNRGGLNVERDYEIMDDEASLSLWFERTVTPQWGLFGGKSGATPSVEVFYPDGSKENLLKVDHLPVPRGTRINVCTGGGGGYGFPWERAADKVLEDVVHGYVSLEKAASEYIVYINADTMKLDEKKTLLERAKVNKNLERG